MQKLILTLVLACLSVMSYGQDETPSKSWKDQFNLNGYVKYMQTNSFRHIDTLLTDNLIHNRLNFKYYPNANLTFSVELRNRLFYGESVELNPFYADAIDQDNGAIDLSFNLIETQSLVLNSTIDRANIEWAKGKWNVRIGRQRINWGINMAWNPNDLFNAYNFIDFDYQERPGSDAIRVQYFNKPMSQIELAYRPGKDLDSSIIAGLYRFNKKGYDFQILAGNYFTDLTIGTGWAGNIFQAGFKGEASYFHPKSNLVDTSGSFVSSVSLDYTFDKGIFLSSGVLFNSAGTKDGDLSQLQTTFGNLSAKNLMPTKWTALLQVSGSFTPIFGGSMTTMYLPSINGFFFIPTLNYSILENWDIDCVGQILFSDYQSQFTNVSNALFFRLRWSY